MLIEEQAGVQYNDVLGTVAADAHSGALLHDCAGAFGIDTDKYFPLRMAFHIAYEGHGKDESIGVGATFYCARRSDVGSDIDGFLKNHRAMSKHVPIVSIHTGMLPLSVVARYVKRFEAVVSRKDCVGTEMESVDRIDLVR